MYFHLGIAPGLRGPAAAQYWVLRFSGWNVQGGWFNDGHYSGLELERSVYLLTRAPYPPGVSLVTRAPTLTDTDLLALSTLAEIHSEVVSDWTSGCL